MPINAQIPLSVQPFQAPDPLNKFAQVLQIQGAQNENALNSMKMQEFQRQSDDRNRLMGLLRGGADANALRQGGFLKEANDWEKNQADVASKQADTGKAKAQTSQIDFDIGIKRAQHAASVLSLARDQASYDTARQSLAATFGPQSVAGMPPQFDPNFVQSQVAQGMTIAQRLNDLREQQKIEETGRHNQASEGIQIRGQNVAAATARRGQDMVDQRSRESNAAGRVPAGYRMTTEGNLEFIPGGPADPNAAKRAAPTEFQGKAAMFGARAQEADKIITDLQGQYSPTWINTKQALGRTPLVGGALEAGANLALSDQSQKAEQAQRDFVNAVLRLESGAAISQGEFDNARRQYFPQPGDSPAVIAQKAQNRKTAIQGLMGNARPGSVAPMAPAGLPSASAIDAELARRAGKK